MCSDNSARCRNDVYQSTFENMTHKEEPWRAARCGLVNGERSERFIEKQDIDAYFKNVKEKYKMFNYTDINDYTKDLFRKTTLNFYTNVCTGNSAQNANCWNTTEN